MKTERTKGIFFADKGDLPTETYLRIDIGEGELCDVASFACDETDNIEANAEFIVKACNSYNAVLGALKSTQIRLNEFVNFHDGMSDEDFEIISSIETDLKSAIENASK